MYIAKRNKKRNVQLTAVFWKWVPILRDILLNHPCPLRKPVLSYSTESMECPGNAWLQAVLSLFSYPSIPETSENPAALLIGGSDNIIITALNGSRLQTLKQLDSNGTHGLDFNHKEESVCWVTSSESSGQLRCARMRKASGFTKEQEVKTVQNLHGMIPFKLSCYSTLTIQYVERKLMHWFWWVMRQREMTKFTVVQNSELNLP